MGFLALFSRKEEQLSMVDASSLENVWVDGCLTRYFLFIFFYNFYRNTRINLFITQKEMGRLEDGGKLRGFIMLEWGFCLKYLGIIVMG